MNVASENVTNKTPQVKLPPRVIDLSGMVFTRLTVLRFCRTEDNYSAWLCQCSCGNTIVVKGCFLRSKNCQSCGCLHHDSITTHGMTKSPEYVAWRAMKFRCYREKDASYRYYGARGITVCDRWKCSFENWLLDVGKRPSPLYTFGRKNNDGNYEPGNCAWELGEEQGNNRRNNIRYSYRGENLTVPQWARKIGINSKTLRARLRNKNLTIQQALETPINTNQSRTEIRRGSVTDSDWRKIIPS